MKNIFPKTNNQSGFTLIELLVVIAIIGILSAVVLASMQDARADARNSVIKQGVKEFGNLAEIDRIKVDDYRAMNEGFFIDVDDGTYYPCSDVTNHTFSGNDDMRSVCQSIDDNYTGSGFGGDGRYMFWQTTATFDKYVIWIKLNSNDTNTENDWFCADSNGSTFEGTIAAGVNIFCP